MPERKQPDIDYDIATLVEDFWVGVPEDYDSGKKYGLLVYISPGPNGQPPNGWLEVLYKNDILYAGANKVGNGDPNERRTGLSVLLTGLMQKEYSIDPKRVYISGLSGGARTANFLAYMHPELYTGAILDCGACFARDVPHEHPPAKQGGQHGADYTVIFDKALIDEDEVKENVRFALVTGPQDWRYGDIVDIYQGGYKPYGYQAELFDIPDMGHHNSSPETLQKAISFLDEGRR